MILKISHYIGQNEKESEGQHEMRKEITYRAEDGTVFACESECKKYENNIRRKRKEEILQEIVNIDQKIWKKYHPDWKDENTPELYQASTWLHTDIVSILLDSPDSLENILKTIKKSKYGAEIIRKYFKADAIKAEVALRKDFLSALQSVKHGSDLAGKVTYSFYPRDVEQLARLHKANKCRKKIEQLLTACNYHEICLNFISKNYEEYLLIDKICD